VEKLYMFATIVTILDIRTMDTVQNCDSYGKASLDSSCSRVHFDLISVQLVNRQFS
jgi:hypothetical protein